jgi:hypothetical protein
MNDKILKQLSDNTLSMQQFFALVLGVKFVSISCTVNHCCSMIESNFYDWTSHFHRSSLLLLFLSCFATRMLIVNPFQNIKQCFGEKMNIQ